MKPTLLLLLASLPCALAAAPQQSDRSSAPRHVMLKASDTNWGEAPPAFEPGAQAAVVAGDPSRAGELFVIRLKAPAGYRIARHGHATDEHVTVIEGDLSLDMGEGASLHSATFGPGDYVLLPARMPHAAATAGGMVLQVHGTGPFEISYADPRHDPRRRAPAADSQGDPRH